MDVDVEPNDSGGVAAKHGFIFQDCVAAYHVTRMLRDKTMHSVRCEVTDDIDIVSDDAIEFIQVKSTAKTRWDRSHIVVNSKGEGKKAIPESSILHKSMQCKPEPGFLQKFQIVTEEKVNKTLEYLTIRREDRAGKPGRDLLITYLTSKIGTYEAPSGLDLGGWIDAAQWKVFHSLREIELMGIKNIRQASLELRGQVLSSEAEAEDIWCRILDTVTRKGAQSRRVHTADDKSYLRADLISWFNARVDEDQKRSGRKIYVKRSLPHILVPFRTPLASSCQKRHWRVLHQQYTLERYRYRHIVENVCNWLDEVFLRPKELADIDKLGHVEMQQRLRAAVSKSLEDVNLFLGRVLLHATVRKMHDSQPIPCALYIDGLNAVKILENVHIVRRETDGDELWVGFSELVTASDITLRLPRIRDRLYQEIEDCFDSARGKILDIKDDDYLLRHDINDILDGSLSFDAHMQRFRFMLFIGYDSSLLTDPETPGHEDDLHQETTRLFEQFIADLQDESPFADLQIDVFVFPAPSLDRLTRMVEEKVREAV